MPFWTDNNNIRLSIKGGEDRMMTSLGHFLPLLRGIESILFDNQSTKFFHTILRDFPDQINSTKLLVLRDDDDSEEMFSLQRVYRQREQIADWLCTERGDGSPRMAVFYNARFSTNINYIHSVCTLYRIYSYTYSHLTHLILQQFLTATSPANFFIRAYSAYYQNIQQSLDGNGKTGEQFIVRKQNNGHDTKDVLVGRCPLTVDGSKWLEEMHQMAAMPKNAQRLENWGIKSMLVTLNFPLIRSVYRILRKACPK
jgi:hypothetical protein